MSHIEEVLSRALLVHERTLPRDIVPPTAPARRNAWPPHPPQTGNQTTARAAEDLRALCETLLTHIPPATAAEFITEQVPEPRSALLLACVLQLTDTDDGARYWWQYAAGAGLPTAAYCLYLHHLALGESATANWWYHQTNHVQPPPETTTPPHPPTYREHDDTSTTTILQHLLRVVRLTARHRHPAVTQLMSYIPDAVATGYLRQPDAELPLPGTDFAPAVRSLLKDVGTPCTVHAPAYSHKHTEHDTSQPATHTQATEHRPAARPHIEPTAAR
ncbi:hypothetical protein [Streptomyces sp. MA15]|uniref:hypothetical protein n=1 Tax=Streptomyces sp. MA15 TaxID=3055061 RepID=UPI0025AF8BCD|nr:hypothetical protein [Streptomyces sp. MA15]MDN3267038.1 hypothetical protein [Streptomyces sp. MA15]